MKKLSTILAAILLCAGVLYAAFIASETFESYSVSDELNGKSGGSNWTGNWTGTNSEWQVDNAPSGMTGKAVKNIASSSSMERNFSAITSAEGAAAVYWLMRVTATNPDGSCGMVLEETGDTPRMYIQFGSDGNIKIFNNGTGETVQAYSANTTYAFTMEFNDGTQPNLFRVKVDAGSFTAYKTVQDGTYTDINTFRLYCEATNATLWVDNIQVPPATGTAQFFIFSGLR